MLTITILTENLVRKRGLLAEHGLSLWVEADDDRVLFDTGSTDVYCHNAKALGIDLTQTQAIVISHGHYDHGGGLAFFPQEACWPHVYIHPDAFLPKFTRAKHLDEPHQAGGFPWKLEDLPHLEQRLVLNKSTVQVSERLFLCAEIPQTVDFETPSTDFLVEKNELLLPDNMHDEQVMVCRQPQGLVVFLGCSHPGVINSLKFVELFFPDEPIHAVIGGMHLERATPQRLQWTMDYFKALDIKQIIPLHCVGQEVIWQMKKSLGDRVLIRRAGEEIKI